MADSPFSSDAKSSLGLLLWQTTTAWQREVQAALAPHGITHAQFVIMAITMYLTETSGEATQADIVRMSRLDKMTVSSGLKKLESLKFAERHIHADDTRIYVITLTNKGGVLARKLVRAVEAVDKHFFGSLLKSDQKNLALLLSHLAHVK